MNILLTGASGFIGRHISEALTRDGHIIRPVSRTHGADFSNRVKAADWLPYLKGVEVVINSVGIIGEQGGQRFLTLHTQAPLALFHACRQAGVRRVVQISALGADATAFSAYHLSKRAADDGLRRLDLDWFVLRPSLIYGRDGASARLFRRLAALPWVPVLGDGQQPVQPVHIRDVVATVQRCLTASPTRQTLDLVGRDRISFAEWLQRLRQAQGHAPARLVHIPPSLAMAAMRLGRRLHPLLRPENLQMLQAGSCADVRPLAQFLGHLPQGARSPRFFADAWPEGASS